MNRRSFLLAAPAVILTPGLLMPVKVAGFTSGLVVLPNQYPMTATEVLLRRDEAIARMAERIVNPPLVAFGDCTIDVAGSKQFVEVMARSLTTMLSYNGRIVPPMGQF